MSLSILLEKQPNKSNEKAYYFCAVFLMKFSVDSEEFPDMHVIDPDANKIY